MFESNSKWNWNPLFPRDSKVLNKRLQKKEKKKTLEYNYNIDRGSHNNNNDNNRSMEENLGRPGVRSETEEPIERGP